MTARGMTAFFSFYVYINRHISYTQSLRPDLGGRH